MPSEIKPVSLKPSDTAWIHSLLLTKLDKSVTHAVYITMNTSEDEALGAAVKSALAAYPDFALSSVAVAAVSAA